MVKNTIAILVALTAVGCGLPSMNDAQVEVHDSRLDGAVESANFMWNDATGGDIHWKRVDHCDDSHACITVAVQPGLFEKKPNKLGNTHWEENAVLGENDAYIVVDPIVLEVLPLDSEARYMDGPTPVLMHEFGHALGLKHHEERYDVMTARTGEGFYCLSSYDLGVFKQAYDPAAASTVSPYCWNTRPAE